MKYKWQQFTLYGGYEYARLSSPSDGADYVGHTYYLNGGYPAVVQPNAYVDAKVQQVLWAGAKYGLLSNLDATVAYFYAWQNNYDVKPSTNCGPNKTPAFTGSMPQGAAASDCAGHENAVSALLDWRPVKRVDVYSGVMFSQVTGGMAYGYIKNSDTSFTSGVRVNF
jgi:hypothetical protein